MAPAREGRRSCVASALPAIATRDPSVAVALVAFAGLFTVQKVVAVARTRVGADRLTDNEPLLLMDGPEILHENLRKANVTEDDLRAKLREANVLCRNQVRAVVLETTGQISVLHTDDPDTRLDPDLLMRVRGAVRLRRDRSEELSQPGRVRPAQPHRLDVPRLREGPGPDDRIQ